MSLQLDNETMGKLPNNISTVEIIRVLNDLIDRVNNLNASARAGVISPISQADADAANNTIYYSTTASKLVYKDSGGVVNNLY